MEIQLIPKNDIHLILPLLKELNPTIENDTLRERLDEMINNNYECITIIDDGKLIGICGVWTLYKYYIGKHLEPDNVYIKSEYRSLGLGQELVNFLIKLAKSRDCNAIELNCYLGNEQGNKFWIKNNFKLIANHYQLKIS